MKAISVRQPWAGLIAIGLKPVENRGRPTSHRGLVAIHASRTSDYAGADDPRVVKVCGPEPLLAVPLGAVVAVAQLVDCHPATHSLASDVTCCPPWGDRWHETARGLVPAWHLVLADAVLLPERVFCRGQVMVPWQLPPDVARAVQAQLAGAVTS